MSQYRPQTHPYPQQSAPVETNSMAPVAQPPVYYPPPQPGPPPQPSSQPFSNNNLASPYAVQSAYVQPSSQSLAAPSSRPYNTPPAQCTSNTNQLPSPSFNPAPPPPAAAPPAFNGSMPPKVNAAPMMPPPHARAPPVQYQQPQPQQQQQQYQQQQYNQPQHNHQPQHQMDQLSNQMGSMSVNQSWGQMWQNDTVNLMAEKDIRTKAIADQKQREANKRQQLSSRDITVDSSILRCTLKKVPDSSNLLQKCRLPLGVVLHPFKDDEVSLESFPNNLV